MPLPNPRQGAGVLWRLLPNPSQRTGLHRKPLPGLPKGRELFHAVFKGVLCGPSPWGRLGWGFYVGWYAPLATLTELRLHSPGLRARPATLGNAPTNNPKPITASIFTPKKTNTDIAELSDSLGKCYQANQRYPYFHQYRPRGNRANPYATPEALYRGAPPWRR